MAAVGQYVPFLHAFIAEEPGSRRSDPSGFPHTPGYPTQTTNSTAAPQQVIEVVALQRAGPAEESGALFAASVLVQGGVGGLPDRGGYPIQTTA